MKREWIHAFLCLLGGTVLAGCDADRPPSSPPMAVRETSDASWSAGTPRPPAADNTQTINLQVGDVQTLGQMIQARRGRVVLIDYWATWCTGCVAMFPHTVALHQQYQPQGLSVMSVSFDDPGQAHEVRAFLHQQQATFDHLISGYTGTESFERFQATVGIPLYRLYDRRGQLRYQFSPVHDEYPQLEPPENMEMRIRELLRRDPLDLADDRLAKALAFWQQELLTFPEASATSSRSLFFFSRLALQSRVGDGPRE